MARQWVKLWTKQLENPEIAELPDYLYRRWIEILMLAGKNDADGLLQPVRKMAYILRLKEAQLSENLMSLNQIGVVHQDDAGNWHVTNWKKHQYSESTDRVRKFRDKKQKEESGDDAVTVTRYNRVTDILISSDSSSLSDSDSSSIERTAERLTGLMVMPGDVETLNGWERDGVTEADIRDALQWRVDQGRPPVKTISQLAGGVAVSHSRRVQGASAKGNGKGAARAISTPESFKESEYAGWYVADEDEPAARAT
jgi:hypothetical protein